MIKAFIDGFPLDLTGTLTYSAFGKHNIDNNVQILPSHPIDIAIDFNVVNHSIMLA